MKCYTCGKVPDVKTCGRCREVLKHEMVELILGMDPVYLSESNRNKNGRPKIIKNCEERYQVYKRYEKLGSLRKVAEEYKISKNAVAAIVKEHRLMFNIKNC